MSTRPAAATQRSRARRASRSSRRRRPPRRPRSTRRKSAGRLLRGIAITAAVTAVVLFAGVMVSVAIVAHALTGFAQGAQGQEGSSTPDVAPPPPPPPGIAGYGVEQLAHACTILTVGRNLGLGERDQTIAVMTAMGESSLRNLEYGDWETSGVTNPDGSRTTSIGLFQQQDSWGTSEERLDPATSARLYYRAMTARVPDRAGLEPTLVAHRTQINDDPRHYARYWHSAERVVAALNGQPVDGDSLRGIPACPSR